MLPYNIDFFNYNGEFITNSNADDIEIETDYISGGDNKIDIINVNNANQIERGGYLHIYRSSAETQETYFGYITGITKDKINNSMVTIRWTDILTAFNVDWCIDTDVQHSGMALETYIAQQMALIAQNVLTAKTTGVALNFITTSSTTSWGFNIKSDNKGMHHAIVNFSSVFIERSLKEYDIAINITPDLSITNQITLNITIGKIKTEPKTIEVDFANVISKSISLHDDEGDINRLTVYNDANYSQKYTYYYGADEQVYREDQDNNVHQKYPIVYEVEAINIQEGQNFVTEALAEATSTFKQATYVNLIEIEVTNNDTLVNPLELNITTIYKVIFNDVIYTTVLTGKKVKNGTTVLTFGTQRLDLTKILKKRRTPWQK